MRSASSVCIRRCRLTDILYIVVVPGRDLCFCCWSTSTVRYFLLYAVCLASDHQSRLKGSLINYLPTNGTLSKSVSDSLIHLRYASSNIFLIVSKYVFMKLRLSPHSRLLIDIHTTCNTGSNFLAWKSDRGHSCELSFAVQEVMTFRRSLQGKSSYERFRLAISPLATWKIPIFLWDNSRQIQQGLSVERSNYSHHG